MTTEDLTDEPTESPSEDVEPTQKELQDFFGGVGIWAPVEEASESGQAPPKRKLRRWVLVAAAGVLLVITAVILKNRPARELPEIMRGEWSTAHPSHADRHFWLGVDSIAFQVGPSIQEVTRHALSKLKARRSVGDTTWYEISYLIEGQETEWPIIFVGGDSRSIRFVNQGGMEWHPVAGGAWPTK